MPLSYAHQIISVQPPGDSVGDSPNGEHFKSQEAIALQLLAEMFH